MSFESALHAHLVRGTVGEIMHRHGNVYGFGIYADLPEYGRQRPPRIGGFVPDVFAIDCPETCRIIGEAKTPFDCETERSLKQIAAFMTHIAKFPHGRFYLAVPWAYAARARNLIMSLSSATGADPAAAVVLDGF